MEGPVFSYVTNQSVKHHEDDVGQVISQTEAEYSKASGPISIEDSIKYHTISVSADSSSKSS